MATSKKTIAAKGELPVVEKKAKAIVADHTTIEKKATVKKSTDKKAAPKKAAVKKTVVKQAGETTAKKAVSTKLHFQLRYHTEFGQNLFLTGNHVSLGNGDIANAIPMQYLNEQAWTVTLDWLEDASKEPVQYNYVLMNADGSTVVDWGTDRVIDIKSYKANQIQIIDTWNHAGYFENAFYTEAFQSVLLKEAQTENKTKAEKSSTHIFRVKSPLLSKNQVVCISGTFSKANNWSEENLVLMQKKSESPFFEISLNLGKEQFPIAYKYGVYDLELKKLIQFESGDNRVLHHPVVKNQITLVNDGFTYLPNQTWKGAGVAIPVFSLRTQSSFGVGEFTDLIKMADWASMVGLKMIQLLPVNDTTATNTNKDSYPYAAISAFALHPLYLNLSKIAGKGHSKQLQQLEKERLQLNSLPSVDYASVINLKLGFAKKVFQKVGKDLPEDKSFQVFFEQNKHWLVSYAAFCYLRDEYGTVDFGKWPAYKNYKEKDIAELTNPQSAAYLDIAFYYFLQYHLHLQLKEATAYAHGKGVIIKGDIAIGVFRHGADTWQHPDLFHMDFQAGAPPDDFAVTGQNWGFPTYNWQRMQEDGFAWWKQRFEQMSHYFDAFRIDHILGFFRIWSIPLHAVEGIMGHFVPAIPITLSTFAQLGIWFDYDRYTKPFITDSVLWEVFGYDNELVKSMFLINLKDGTYSLKHGFETQRQVEQHFATLDQDVYHEKIKKGLFSLISNIILFDADGTREYFHFRYGIENTSTFKNLEYSTQQQLRSLYLNYFFKQQDEFWKKEANNKLPALKRVTNMLVCGEDLGMVPGCVPEVMQQLGLLSLEIQRMPKNPETEFFHPNDAPYLSVVTPSTHDMSTIRGWWEEDKNKIQHFYNHQLGQWGDAPYYCEAWINKAIVLQHLYSPAMWSVFQIQDLMGMNEKIRREDPLEEQINVPANPNHYWCYRMHTTIEELILADDFNQELLAFIKKSGR
ncbi:MAG TPA: 4-alpha-glucanotransferase [Sediminibacterium sp.]|uniref:4-alpha-glucanotransferase n=1 Tax=Sediminibacterium sp. TaxID=1917865 RepID=UPI000AAA8064|nr:4-alpha-glucanotransferase [Sediminibacterium sp.]HLD52280.1 4-alpha-glucanotransferase [Sediminibacterium sp.]